MSCSFLTALIVTGICFHKKRHLAVPIVTMFGGLGIASFPSLLRRLADEYALRGMFLILAGISLHVVLFGLVVRTCGASKDLGGKDPEMELETEEAERKGNIRHPSDRGQTDGEMLNLKQRHAVVTISENVEILRYDCETTGQAKLYILHQSTNNLNIRRSHRKVSDCVWEKKQRFTLFQALQTLNTPQPQTDKYIFIDDRLTVV